MRIYVAVMSPYPTGSGRYKYGSELILTDRKQDDARKARRKSDVLVDNWKEGRNTNEARTELSMTVYSCTRCWNLKFRYRLA